MAVRNTGSLLLGLALLLRTWGVWAIEITMEDKVEVHTGVSANIICTFMPDLGSTDMAISWFYFDLKGSGEKKELYYQDPTVREVRQGTPLTDRISVSGPGERGDVVLTIHNVRVQDELEFICVGKHLLLGEVAEGRTQLRVFETPDRPTIEGVTTGLSVNDINKAKIGVCEVKNGYPRPNITWYRNEMPLRNSDDVEVIPRVTVEMLSGLISVSSELHMKVAMEDKDSKFYCEVNYFVPGMVRMTETDRISINVLYPSTVLTLWVESPTRKIKEGDTVRLHCAGNGNSLTLFSIGPVNGFETAVEEPYVLVLEKVTRRDGGQYQCSSLDIETFDQISQKITVDVNYLDPAEVMPGDTIVLAQGEEMKATCNALSSLPTITTWFKDGEEVFQGHTLMVKEVTLDSAGTYLCKVTVPEIEGMETSTTLHAYVKGPPRITTEQDTEIEESAGNSVELRCAASGFPSISITWSTADGQVIGEATKTEMETGGGAESAVRIQVDSDITVLCNASNEYGSDALTFSIKAKSIGGVIAVLIVYTLLLAVLGSMFYVLCTTGKICGHSGKQDLTKDPSTKDDIVVEMKSDNTEEAVLLGVNGEKLPPGDQVDVRSRGVSLH
ncbi:cell surface glycoprotein MUC18-like isoform X2 [Betta splendens]|uniref:Cell surface glycoprotein MUC18-like isoform X2 n=1 Tax=Betta splendens TaxID=158456 RepID=A0A6P7P3Y6_BETSP|nr:cell surface glycoprotein MUC18-like isoform X2 [Betta splendens]